ncbi:PspC domain-containing protein [Paenibacillus thermotolerans]|uniref:PspC domain-containing protein n=1 Tax=Paenibacillus thermotolerans TaxID=3027807 RepID=UPI002368C001|nr:MULTISPECIES: PspC domain-containing protein [unclassified Paenibacillus]
MRKLYRSATNSRISGVCGGLAEYLGISATFVRFVTVVSALCSFGTTLLVYFIASIVIPKQDPYLYYR